MGEKWKYLHVGWPRVVWKGMSTVLTFPWRGCWSPLSTTCLWTACGWSQWTLDGRWGFHTISRVDSTISYDMYHCQGIYLVNILLLWRIRITYFLKKFKYYSCCPSDNKWNLFLLMMENFFSKLQILLNNKFLFFKTVVY